MWQVTLGKLSIANFAKKSSKIITLTEIDLIKFLKLTNQTRTISLLSRSKSTHRSKTTSVKSNFTWSTLTIQIKLGLEGAMIQMCEFMIFLSHVCMLTSWRMNLVEFSLKITPLSLEPLYKFKRLFTSMRSTNMPSKQAALFLQSICSKNSLYSALWKGLKPQVLMLGDLTVVK